MMICHTNVQQLIINLVVFGRGRGGRDSRFCCVTVSRFGLQSKKHVNGSTFISLYALNTTASCSATTVHGQYNQFTFIQLPTKTWRQRWRRWQQQHPFVYQSNPISFSFSKVSSRTHAAHVCRSPLVVGLHMQTHIHIVICIQIFIFQFLNGSAFRLYINK